MTEIYKESESIDTSALEEEIVVENYFAGANRADVLSRMKEAVQSDVALMVLTGDEGSGKTMMCRMLEHEMPPSCITVMFPQTVDSFEDVVKSVATQLGLDVAATEKTKHVEDILQQIAEFLKSASKDLLVIFDEAENIYLATLERNRKMLDLINGSGARMHILFSGRNTLIENCDQLSICDFQNRDELHFKLSPLSEAETVQYLKAYGNRLADVDCEKVFSDIHGENVYRVAKGNFRMTNFLAEELIKVNGDEASFRMLLDSVKGEAGTKEKIGEKHALTDIFKRYTDYLPWIGGGLCCLLLLLFLFRPGDEQNEAREKQQPEKIKTVTSVTSESTRKPEQGVLPKKQTENTQRAGGSVVEKPAKEKETVAKKMVPEQTEVGIVEPPPTVHGELPDPGAGKDESPEVKIDKEPEEPPVEVKIVENIQPSKERVIVELRSTGLLKRKPAFQPQVQRRTIELKPPPMEIKKVIVPDGYFNADQLLRERFSAGTSWQNGVKNTMYTVQLMVLASRDAEKNLLQMLVQENYRQEAGNFFIFKKASPPGNIFVFYGEYPNIAMARLAQDSLPRFLRDHKPYVISIKGAIDKVQ